MIVDISKNILIVGMGLLGGSYAKGLKRFGFKISAIDKDEDAINYALSEKIIDYGTTKIDAKMINEADLIIFALYPKILADWIKENQKHFKDGVILTDVTGVKTCIVYEIQEMLKEGVEFIGAHPMAGREVLGVRNSTDEIFKGANYIVTPTDKNTPKAIETCKEIGRLLGFANVETLSPEEHDDMIGFVSQLTHCIAITLMTCNDRENIEKFTGDSFRDLTRIARINDLMWSELFMANKEPLLNQMDLFLEQFKKLKTMLETGDVESMREMMRYSTKRRSLFDKN